MMRCYDTAARLSGIAAVVCAVLALLTSPAVSRADEYEECVDDCGRLYDPNKSPTEYQACVEQCIQQGGLTKCKDASCDDGLGGCVSACQKKACNEGGKNPATAKCDASTYGCRCN